MISFIRIAALLAFVAISSSTVLAQDYEGWTAEEIGADLVRRSQDPDDYEAQFYIMSSVADQGEVNAQYNVGVHYLNGLGVEQDYRQAIDWFRRAANQGDRAAQYNLAIMYFKGMGVSSDVVTAHMWSNIASLDGDGEADALRREIQQWMGFNQMVEGVRRANACISSDYQDCD